MAFPILSEGAAPRISSLLIKPASAVCNLDCAYCFYLDRDADPYKALPARRMTLDTLERLVDTYLFYSYPASTFAFQGGEPTLAGLRFLSQTGRASSSATGATASRSAMPCKPTASCSTATGASCSAPTSGWWAYRSTGRKRPTTATAFNKEGRGTWKRVVEKVELLARERVEFNILCVLSQANVDRPKELYRFFRGLGVENLQFIPLAEFDGEGNPLPFTITPEQYGRFLCEIFDLWWPERRRVRVRFFDNIAEALAGQKPGNCTMHETCDSYVVVEYNGDVYPCDFFVESGWKLGNITLDSWAEIARRTRRYSFAAKKTIASCRVPGLRIPIDLPRRLPQATATAARPVSRTWTTSARPTR